MTVIVVWYEKPDNALWSVADTRISRPGQGGGQVVLTDSGAKLFSLPVSCREVSTDPSVKRYPYYASTFGYAFAGDVLPAAMTIATTITITQELIAYDAKLPPRLADIANLVRRLSERFSREVLSSSHGNYGKFEAVVFGYCPHANALGAFHLRPELSQGQLSVSMSECAIGHDDSALVFGNGRTRAIDKIAQLRSEGDHHRRTVRLPKLAVEALIREDSGDVGGSLSVGIAGHWGFSLYGSVQPIEEGKPPARRTFNGIDLDEEIGMVGPCAVGMSAQP